MIRSFLAALACALLLLDVAPLRVQFVFNLSSKQEGYLAFVPWPGKPT